MDDEPRSPRARQRREQILDAASACFARYGFHGASIAQISKQAGMSPGHIYHFFDNKEAIVAGIVERMAARWLELLEPYPTDVDVVATVVERATHALAERTRPDFIGLWLEVLAETARNATVAQSVGAVDERIRAAVTDQVRYIREMRGVRTDTPLDAIVEVVLALYEGLSNRAAINAMFDREGVRDVLLRTTYAALEA
ncbi:MAG: TetR/AcrR family transcriptional regulator [Gammaproteobacteria bacterium]